MTNLKFFFKKISFYCKRLFLLSVCLTISAFCTSSTYAANLTASAGHFQPHDGIVRDLFKSSEVLSLRLGISYQPTFDWTLAVTTREMESKVNGLENDITLNEFSIGFEKRFPDFGDVDIPVEPFIGAGLSLFRMSELVDDEIKEVKSDKEESTSWGMYWEIGLLVPVKLFSRFYVEIKFADHTMEKNVFGNIHMGGRVASLGIRKGF